MIALAVTAAALVIAAVTANAAWSRFIRKSSSRDRPPAQTGFSGRSEHP